MTETAANRVDILQKLVCKDTVFSEQTVSPQLNSSDLLALMTRKFGRNGDFETEIITGHSQWTH